MTRCRWDREREDYVTDGEFCRTDDYGDPTRHCTARRTCAEHVGWGELTCARCVGRTRADVRQLPNLMALMFAVALSAGTTDTDAAMLAGPAADMDEYAENREAVGHHLDMWVAQGRISERQYLREWSEVVADDESHPANILGVWCRMWALAYGLTMPNTAHMSASLAFIEANLHKVAQDENQDFPLFAREVRACRTRLESVLHNSHIAERGAPCPSCPAPAPRLTREYGHWCDDEACERLHYPEDPDRWVCPRDRAHVWEEDDYRKWVADVYEANRSA